jgi:4-carboxymuconolactone decarboxylase
MRSIRAILSLVLFGPLVALMGCAPPTEGGEESLRLREPRIYPIPESEWSEEQRQALTPLKREDGHVINLYTTLIRYPELSQSWSDFGAHVLRGSALPPRDREILILRTGWLCRSEYEFGQHTLIGKRVGLSDGEILAVTQGPAADAWSEFEAALIRAADELHQDAFITDDTWHVLAERYDEKQLIDVVMTVGQYHLVSMTLNSLGVQLDPGVPGFPQGVAE